MASSLEKQREYSRQYRARNRDKEIERGRRYRAENPQKAIEQQRRYRANRGVDGRRVQVWALNHGMRPEDWAALWDSQDGCCYLCGDEMDFRQSHIDHDHRCCPENHSCRYCRRGLACPNCNQLVGLARDDPARLRRIAGNLEIALKDADVRLALKPRQEMLS